MLDEIAAGREPGHGGAGPVLLRQRRPRGAQEAGQRPRRHRRPRAVDVPARRRHRARVGRYGPYVENSADGNRANVPDDLPPDELTLEKARGAAGQPRRRGDRARRRPETGRRIVAKDGRYGPYVTEVLEDDAPKGTKPRTGSLFKTMSLDTITLDDALKLLSLPRGGRRRPRAARRSLRRTGATARTSRRARTRARSSARSSCSRSRSTRRWRSTPSPSSVAGPRRRRRCASSATDPVSRQAGRGQGRPLRAVRHRRRDQRDAAQGRRPRRRSPRERAAELLAEKRAKGPTEEAGREEDDQEDREEDSGQEDRQVGEDEPRARRRPRPKKAGPRSPDCLRANAFGAAGFTYAEAVCPARSQSRTG